MGDDSKIQWTDATWNPTRGCSRVSDGCTNCYAMGQAHRFSAPGHVTGNGVAPQRQDKPQPYAGLTTIRRGKVDWSGRVILIPEMLDRPLRWKRPRRVFVNSMSDLFHEALTDGEILAVFMTMWRARHHTFQVLTKRAKRMREWVERWNDLSGETFEFVGARGPEATRGAHPSGRGQMYASYLETLGEPPPGAAFPTFDWAEGPIGWGDFAGISPHIWLGVSAENQKQADKRIPDLLACPAAVRFVSAEPLLGPIELQYGHGWLEPFHDTDPMLRRTPRLDWVIVGGESGHGARPCDVEWIRSIVGQCREAQVACFVKQLGAHPFVRATDSLETWPTTVRWVDDPELGEDCEILLNDRKGGDLYEWADELQVREFPQ